MVAWRIKQTEGRSRRNLHLAKATTKAKERGEDSLHEIGRPRTRAASALVDSPGAKESPGSIGDAMEGQPNHEAVKEGGTGKIFRLTRIAFGRARAPPPRTARTRSAHRRLGADKTG